MARCGICSGFSENNTELPDPYELILYSRRVMGRWCDRCIEERTGLASELAVKLRSLNDESAKNRESTSSPHSSLTPHHT